MASEDREEQIIQASFLNVGRELLDSISRLLMVYQMKNYKSTKKYFHSLTGKGIKTFHL